MQKTGDLATVPYRPPSRRLGHARAVGVLDGSDYMATMDEKRSPATSESAQRRAGRNKSRTPPPRARRFSSQRTYLDRLENELSQGLQLLADELSRDVARNLAQQASTCRTLQTLPICNRKSMI